MNNRCTRVLLIAFLSGGYALAEEGGGKSSAKDKKSPFLPEFGELSKEEGNSSRHGTMDLFDSVIRSSQEDQLASVEKNIEYNEQRKGELTKELQIRQRALESLAERAGIQFDRVSALIGDEGPTEHLEAAARLKRQYQATRSGLQREIQIILEDLAMVNARLAEGGLQKEVLSVRRQLSLPFAMEMEATETKERTPHDGEKAVGFFRDLSAARVRRRSAQIVGMDPRPVDDLVVALLIHGGK